MEPTKYELGGEEVVLRELNRRRPGSYRMGLWAVWWLFFGMAMALGGAVVAGRVQQWYRAHDCGCR